ncbi:RagB/SusD family nutrient uptake outer membrane protein [Pseudoflavitalea sp. X16]|uniref:RagB/SusD family nutrient uptake outer membrane protein n=1 Tax=Paraflavitalea devenefica TaxID=2716334 RepID=UPI00142419FE|nr:RagB/SusD family nutrient uptake outer membrane protein [Paraflavitalea devenefica]NII27013.1 RagB/SusD family nutrient uptake outer membrane protein [Paraflavitalea devenefica]
MKQTTFYTTLLIAILALPGCSKFLEHDNPTAITDDQWWNTATDALNALNAVYVGIPDGASGRQLMFLAALSDEAVARQSTRGDYESFVKGLHNVSWNVGEGIWEDDFKDIRRACRFLENVDRCFMEEDLKTRYKYEARALRAYYHMELMMFFGGIPIVTASVTTEGSYLKRNTEEEVYNFVVEELTACAPHLPTVYTTNTDYKRITEGTCWALISKLALFYKKYEVARDAAKKVIDLGVYELYKSSNLKNSYADLFLYAGEVNKERIFFRENTGSGGQWNTFAPQGVGGKTVVSPTAAAVNNYETKQGKTIWELGPDSAKIYQKDPNYKSNRDPRLAASLLLPGQTYSSYVLKPFETAQTYADRIGAQNATATGFWVNKYLDPKDRNAAAAARTLDYMIIRYAEVLLNYAEALIELDQWNNPDVVKYINEVRTRATMPNVDVTTYNSQETLRTLIRRERQAELAFEGGRFFDIRRWGILGTVMNGQVYGAVDPTTNEPIKVEVRSCNPDRDYRWPIPQKEILANPKMEQNDKY